jgi:2'-5' RNA ligase
VTRRLFVALPIPDDLRTEIGRTRRTIERELPEAAWVRPPNQHLTLKFLGDTDDDRERELVEALGTVASAPIPIRLAGGGFFPPGRSPRVAWLGGHAAGAAELAARVDVVVSECGFGRERRQWSLHLTQARIRRPWSRAHRDRYLQWTDQLQLPSFTATRMVLFASELRPSGAVYTSRRLWTLE